MKLRMSVEGLREASAGLGSLSKAAQRGVLTRVMKKAAKPVEDAAKRKVRADSYKSGGLYNSIGTRVLRNNPGKFAYAATMRGGGTKQEAGAAAHSANKAAAGRGASVTLRVQASAPHAQLVERGTVKMDAEPFMAPALEQNRGGVISTVAADIRNEVEKAAKRAATRAAKKAART